MAEWPAIEGKRLIKIILQDKVPSWKLGHMYTSLPVRV